MRDSAAKTQARKNRDMNDDDSAAQSNQPKKWSDYTVEFHFPEPTELNPPLIQLIDVDFKYPNRDDFGLKNVNRGVDMGSRIAIVGPNGAGKVWAAAGVWGRGLGFREARVWEKGCV